MNKQSVDPHLAELAAKYAEAAQEAYACDVDNTDPDNGFQFAADGYLIQVYRVEPAPYGKLAPDDWYEWRIKKDGATVAEIENDRIIFSNDALAEAWLQFTRLIPANEDWESDAEAEALYETARRAAA